MVYTSTNILDSVKRNVSIVSSTFRFQDADLYSMVDEEIENTIIPMILRLHSDRLIFRETRALTASVSTYAIPYRAIGSQLRDIVLQDAATPTWIRNLTLLEYGEGSTNVQTGDPTSFYFSGDNIILVPSVATSTTNYLAFSYPIKHPRLVASSAVGTITSVDYTTGVVTFNATIPSTYVSGAYFDFLIANDRSKPRLAGYDKVPTAVGTTTMTFTVADIPTGLVAGDKVPLARQTDVLLLPDECYKYLCKAVEIKIMEAQKDLQAVEAAQKRFTEARMAMESILTPRITGEPRYIKRGALLSARKKRMVGISNVS